MEQMTAQAMEAFGLDRTVDDEYSGLRFCFEPAGWTLAEHMGYADEVLPLLLGQLSAQERSAWAAFADGHMGDREGESIKALLLATHLEQTLPACSLGADEPTAPARRRGPSRL